MFELPGLDGVEEVVINREVAESRANPLFLYGKERAESTRLSRYRRSVTDRRRDIATRNFKTLRCMARQPIWRLISGVASPLQASFRAAAIRCKSGGLASTVHKEVNYD